MSDRQRKPVRTGLAIAALLLTTQFKVSMAFAQEPIMLETIGAVRMAQPGEMQRMNAERKAFHAKGSQKRSEARKPFGR